MASLPPNGVDATATDLASSLRSGGVVPTPAEYLPFTSLPFPALTLGTVLAIVATALLVFVSVGVIYLSTVEWRDRRRRGSSTPRG